MQQAKKMTGKGHTLYETDLPAEPADIWVLVAESCYEISRTLLAEESYAEELYFAVSGYDHDGDRGGFGLQPEGYLRYPAELYRELYADSRTHELIRELFSKIRRVQVRAACAPYVIPLFFEEGKMERQFDLLERVRRKTRVSDVIGLGMEGMRKKRIKTYTPKRADEIHRAMKLMGRKPELLSMLGCIAERSYWHRVY